MASKPALFTRGLSGLSQSIDPNSPVNSVTSPTERHDAKTAMLKAMRPLPTQHYWNVYFDRPSSNSKDSTTTSSSSSAQGDGASNYQTHLEQLGGRIESVQDFWRYHNNTPVLRIAMRESIYLFKVGFKPVWEDRRNILGGSWTFRVPKSAGPDVWTRVQLLAIGEKLEGVLEEGDQICGVGLSVRFNSHLISIWHRHASKRKSVDNILACVLEDLPAELNFRPDNYFYKRHSDHASFKAPPELQAVIDSQRRIEEAQAKAAVQQATSSAAAASGPGPAAAAVAAAPPEIQIAVASPGYGEDGGSTQKSAQDDSLGDDTRMGGSVQQPSQ